MVSLNGFGFLTNQKFYYKILLVKNLLYVIPKIWMFYKSEYATNEKYFMW